MAHVSHQEIELHVLNFGESGGKQACSKHPTKMPRRAWAWYEPTSKRGEEFLDDVLGGEFELYVRARLYT